MLCSPNAVARRSTGGVFQSCIAKVVRPLGGGVRRGRVGHHVDIFCAADERKKGAKRHEGSTAGADIVCTVGIRVALCVIVVGSLRMSLCISSFLWLQARAVRISQRNASDNHDVMRGFLSQVLDFHDPSSAGRSRGHFRLCGYFS